MPKPGKFNGKPSWKKQYSDADGRESDTRRVSFKSHHKNFKKGPKDWYDSIRAHLAEEDIDMGSSSEVTGGRVYHKKFNKGGGQRSGSPAPRKLFDGPISWYRVHLPHGNRYEKDYIVKTLQESTKPLVFWPITWRVLGTGVQFYIDDFKVAQKLNDLNRTLTLPDGFKLIIKVNSGFPNVELNDQLKEKIKVVMSKRYDITRKALDLSKFHADADLQDVFCALFKPIIFLTVLDIIAQNIPDVEAINLSQNKLSTLSFIKKLHLKLPMLKMLHLGENKDGIDLPAPIGFDISEEGTLPSNQQTYLCNQQGEPIIRQFLEQYFQVFDSENRQQLLQAYHENAMFSITCSYPYGQKDKSLNWLNWYLTESRNILRITDNDRRMKLLRQGQLQIVSFLQEMPGTKHFIHTFTVDLVVYTTQMITVVMTGLFKEFKSGHKTPPTRYFMKSMCIVPAGAGFCIINETLHISNATEGQLKDTLKVPAPTEPIPIATVSSPVAQVQVAPTTPEPDDATKQQMIQALSQQSRMNLEWSGKCLAETQWNYNRAVSIFAELNSQGVIPAEAFIV